MASSKDFVDYVAEQLSDLDGISFRKMMGEYIIYYRGRIAGGIYDNRLMFKPVRSAVEYMNEVIMDLPYPGAKEMILVDNLDDREYLTGLFQAAYDELETPKKRQ